MKRNGFAAVVIILIVVIILALAGGIWYYEMHHSQNSVDTSSQSATGTNSTSTAGTPSSGNPASTGELAACDKNIIQTYSTGSNPANSNASTPSDLATIKYLEAIDPSFSPGYSKYVVAGEQLYYADLSPGNGVGYNKFFTITFSRIGLADLANGNAAGIHFLNETSPEPNQLIAFLGIGNNALIYEVGWYEVAPDGSKATTTQNTSGLYAINASSGASMWNRQPSPVDKEQIANNIIYGISTSGNLTAIDPASGKTMWTVPTVTQFTPSSSIVYAVRGGSATPANLTAVDAHSGAVINTVALDYPGSVLGSCDGWLYIDTDEFPDQTTFSIYRANPDLTNLTQIFTGPVPESSK